jgi:hypothetical protein
MVTGLTTIINYWLSTEKMGAQPGMVHRVVKAAFVV